MTKVKTIDKILTAAKAEISNKGVDGAKIESIAREAGVTKQLVYHYFKTKDELYSAILDSVSPNVHILTNAERYQELKPSDAITAFINTIFDDFINNPSYAAFALDQALHEGRHISDRSEYIPSMKQCISEVIGNILERGIKSGEFKTQLNPKTTFWMVFQLSTSCFLNEKTMSETCDIDFTSQQGIELWRKSTIEFVLNALRA